MACTPHFWHCHCCRACSRLANICLFKKRTMKLMKAHVCPRMIRDLPVRMYLIACSDLCGKIFIIIDDTRVVSCCKRRDDQCAMSELPRSRVGSTWSTNFVWVSALLLFSSMCPFRVPPLVRPQICLLCVSVGILHEVCTVRGSTHQENIFGTWTP